MSWGEGLASWASTGSIGKYLLQDRDKTKAKKEAQQREGELRAEDLANQKEFAQNGLRWKVEDARRAGIHPLYALGGSSASYSSPSISSGGGDYSNDSGGYADAAFSMGQNITRAISQTRTGEERQMAQLQLANAKADLDGRTIDNQIKASQLRNLQTGPAFPGSDNFMPGQGDSRINMKPGSVVMSKPGHPNQQAGNVTDVGFARTETGLVPVPSVDVKERIEDQIVPETMWALRNYIMPNINRSNAPPKSELPKGADEWRWSPFKQEWQPNDSQKWDWYYGTGKKKK